MNKSAVLLAGLITCSGAISAPLQQLELGYMGLPQQVTTTPLAKGMELHQVTRGEVSPYDYYTLSSGAISDQRAGELVKQLSDLGYSPRAESAAEYGPNRTSLGTVVRIGRFADLMAAKKLETQLSQSGITMAVRYTAEDGGLTAGPFDISILQVDLNRYRGKIASVLAHDKVPGKETVTSIAERYDALAAVNAGFFAWNTDVGTPGDPAGIAVIDGELVSEATDGRGAMIIENGDHPRVWVAHNVRTEVSMGISDTTWTINGINRDSGKILNCGNPAGNPISQPAHDFVCHNDNETILFDRHFGQALPAGSGFQFRLDASGLVVDTSSQLGGEAPEKGHIVQAMGSAAETLRKKIRRGQRLVVSKRVFSDEGEIPLKPGMFMVNGGPTLIQNGLVTFSARGAEGWETDFGDHTITDTFVDKKDTATVGDHYTKRRAGFYHGWVVRRHPRTAIGLTQDNQLYVVVVYGRQPGETAGASLSDVTQILRNLGAVEAFNLDGGGSTAMVVQGKLTGVPSDKTGERAVGDALIFSQPEGE